MSLFVLGENYTFGDWFMGEFLRAFLNYIYFYLAILFTYVPVLNWATSFLFGWAAVANLYFYDYQLLGAFIEY